MKMRNVIAILGLTTVFLLAGQAAARGAVRVLILPFEIHAEGDQAYLANEIPRTLKEDLRQENIDIIEISSLKGLNEIVKKESPKGVAGFRNIGMFAGADHIVWGSLTRIGQHFSLDAKLLSVLTQEPPETFFVEGEGIESLLLQVKKLGGQLALKLFKLETITAVRVTGNNRIEEEAIKRKIKTEPGDVYLLKQLSEDLKAIYQMGYFDDVRIETEKGPAGRTVIFQVKEKPTIRSIHLRGNRVLKDDKIMENLTIKTGSILNINEIRKNIERIDALYKDKNYNNAKIEYEIKPHAKNQASLDFIISEGEKTAVRKISFIGNNAFSERKLKRVMTTKVKGFFSFITSSGDLKQENLDQDVAKLTAFYQNHGYIQAKVGEPKVEFIGHEIHISIKIDEGERFRVGEVNVVGDLILPAAELKKKLKITREKFYNREVVRQDVITLSDVYSDDGYAYADVSPKVDQDEENRVVHLTFQIQKGEKVYFEKILISGNTVTRDKVIRRELRIYEQELYSGQRLKRGVRNLHRLDYFKDVKVDTQKGSEDDKMVLKLQVEEKPTGAFSLGGGYSTADDFFVLASLEKKNFLGKGQTASIQGRVGGNSRYVASFTEPWLFDIPLSAGIDLYKQTYDYTAYDKDSVGGDIKFSYPLHDFVRLYWSYTYDITDVHDIESSASSMIWDIEGENVTSKVGVTLKYDSRDRIFNPTEGSEHSIAVEYAGIGGDFAFTKVEADTGWYIPFIGDTLWFLHGKTGYVTENSGGRLPDFERFYLGGINSMRGYDTRSVCALDADGAEIGGEKMLLFNIEYQIPLFKDVGIVGLLFYDTGNVYAPEDEIDPGNLLQSVGFGFRWYSPVGPIRLEYGYRLDETPSEGRGGRWEFAMGFSFF